MRQGQAAARLCGAGIVVLITLVSIFAPLIAWQNPNASGDDLLAGVSWLHWFGTDDLGRDVFSRVVYGGRVSLVIGLGAATASCVIGVAAGMVAGMTRGWIAIALVQLIDLFIALPGLVLALVITVVVGASMTNLMVVLAIVQWPTIARIVRGQVLSVREMLFVDAARVVGSSPAKILLLHIWPNIMHVVAAQFAVEVSAAIFTSASLSFLGLGLPPPTPDWGGMAQSGFEYLQVNPCLSLAPGAFVTLTIFGFYSLGRAVD